MMAFKIAFFKGEGSLKARLFGYVVRWWDRGHYSHCELIFSDGLSGTAFSGGVVLRQRTFSDGEWDYIDLPTHLESAARKWFQDHEGKSYDYVGLLRFVFGFLSPSRDKWFCSRACADALGLMDGWRESPNGLYSEIRNAVLL
jgi:hypothetical protein